MIGLCGYGNAQTNRSEAPKAPRECMMEELDDG